jgi:hypothetical protein
METCGKGSAGEMAMSPESRFAIGVAMLLALQVVLATSAIYLIRWRKRIEPKRSWIFLLYAYFLLSLIVTGVSFIPVAGPFVAIIVSLIGLKRLSGLQVIPTVILAFCLGIIVFLLSAGLSALLDVNILSVGADPFR